MSIGLRVVRGPDWKLGDTDGGEGHLGTVVGVKDDDSVDVIWDNGNQTTCAIGKRGRKELRVIDNAPAGIKHYGISCKECKKQPILGVRWKCCTCKDVSLCTICYFADKHNLTHEFERFNRQTTNRPEKAAKRATSQKMRAFGIFREAVVVRGKDWEYENDDGGPGCKGTVKEVINYRNNTGARNAVKVKWATGKTGEYRVGSSGKMDVRFVDPGVGMDYYRDHLYVPDSSIRLTREYSFIDAKPTPKGNIGFLERNDIELNENETANLDTVIHVGDRVCVFLPVEELKQAQRGRGGWSMRMSECIGRIGKVKRIISDEIIEVEYDGISWQLYQGAMRKVYDIKERDLVRILSGEEMVKLLQKGHGGWDDDMAKACGKIGRVESIDKDGDVLVEFGEQVWVYSPACLLPVHGGKIDKLPKAHGSSRTTTDTRDDLEDSLARLMAHLIILGQHQQKQFVGAQQMAQAAAKGEVETVKKLIKADKNMVNCKFKDLTPLMVASHEGHMEIVKLLLANGAQLETKTADGVTAVLVAAAGKQEEVAIYLLDKGASINLVDKNKRSLAHHACYLEMTNLLKKVLLQGCDPNLQDDDGDTALHDAIAKGNDDAVDLLLDMPKINLTLTNNKDFNPLIFAAFKEHDYAVEKLLQKSPDLVKTVKEDGSSALHVAAVNNHTNIAATLIEQDVSINLKDKNGQTPLHLACQESYFEMVELLIDNDADVNAQDNDGDTPLHVTLGVQKPAILGLLGLMLGSRLDDESDRVKIACLLINNGTEYNKQNKNGKTALQICKSKRVREGVENFIKEKEEVDEESGATENPFLQLLNALLIIPCIACKENVANATFKPCDHKIVCEECSVKFDLCPNCRSLIEDRLDNEGRRIVVEDPCNVQ